MRPRYQGLSKLGAVVGGFIIMAGILILGVAALALAGFLNIDILIEQKYLSIFGLVMVVVGLLDTFSAVIIARW